MQEAHKARIDEHKCQRGKNGDRDRQMRTHFTIPARISLSSHHAGFRMLSFRLQIGWNLDYNGDDWNLIETRAKIDFDTCKISRDEKYLIFPSSGVCPLLRRCDSICREEWWWSGYAAAWTRPRRDAYGWGSSAADN